MIQETGKPSGAEVWLRMNDKPPVNYPIGQGSRLTACRASDIVADSQTRRLNFLFAAEPFPTLAQRIANRKAVNELVGAAVADRKRQEVVDALTAAGIPCSPVNTVAEYVADTTLIDAGVLQNVEISGEDVALAGPLFDADFLPAARHAPPRPGEHTNDVLQSIGFSAVKIDRLREQGAIK